MIYKKYHFILVYIFIIYQITFSYAYTDNLPKTIQIRSDYQTIDISNNTILFQGKVIVTYQNFILNSEKILVHRKKNKENFLSEIKAYGNPITIYQTQELKQIIFAQALKIHYNSSTNIISLIGDVYINKSGSSIKSDYVTYTIKNKIIKALCNQGNQITTTIKINRFK